jgi:hypothetical protein
MARFYVVQPYGRDKGCEATVIAEVSSAAEGFAEIDRLVEQMRRTGAPSDYIELIVVDEQQSIVKRPTANTRTLAIEAGDRRQKWTLNVSPWASAYAVAPNKLSSWSKPPSVAPLTYGTVGASDAPEPLSPLWQCPLHAA